MVKHDNKWLFLFPVLLALAVNANVLWNGFGWDDENIIRQIGQPRAERSDPSLFVTPSPYYRPVIQMSYRLEHRLWGAVPFGFHLTVWLAHALNTALVFLLARVLIDSSSKTSDVNRETSHLSLLTSHNFIPLAAASIFAVHPVHAEAVAWIAGRNDVFCTAFMLASLIFYLRGRPSGSRALLAAAFGFLLLALLTKEEGLALIPVVVLLEIVRWRQRPGPRFPGQDRPGGFLSKTAVFWVPLLIISAFYAILRFTGAGQGLQHLLSSKEMTGSDLLEVLSAFGLYIKMLVLPFPHRPFIAAIPSSPQAILFSATVAVLLAAGLLLALRKRLLPVGTGLAWMLSGLAPPLAVAAFPLAATPAAERYAYAPSVGFAVLAAWLLLEAWPVMCVRLGFARNGIHWGAVACVLVVVLFSWMTWNRNGVWRDLTTFWAAAAASSPGAGQPHRLLGIQFEKEGRYRDAEEQLRTAAEIYEGQYGPDHLAVGDTLYDLAEVYYAQGDYRGARPLLERSLFVMERTFGPSHGEIARVAYRLAAVDQQLGDLQKARSLYERVIPIQESASGPESLGLADSLNNLGVLYRSEGRADRAEPLLKRSVEIKRKLLGPRDLAYAKGLNNLALLYQDLARPEAAESAFRESLKIHRVALGPDDPDTATVLRNLAGLYAEEGRPDEAEPLMREVIRIHQSVLGSAHPAVRRDMEDLARMMEKSRGGDSGGDSR